MKSNILKGDALFRIFIAISVFAFIMFDNSFVPRIMADSDKDVPLGKWSEFRPDDAGAASDEIEEIMSLSYLQGSRLAPDTSGVTIYNETKAYKGLNLYNSGHGPEALLIDMQGKVLHRWKYDFRQVWPDHNVQEFNKYHDLFWRRVHLYNNGDLLAIFEGIGLIKLDKDSNLLWAHKGREHHALQVVEDGSIYILSRDKKLVPDIDKQSPILEGFITILDPQGKEVKRVSLLECVQRSPFEFLLDNITHKMDIFHTNTIEVFDGKFKHLSEVFKKGNVLVVMYHIGTLAIVDLDEEKVVWILPIQWRDKHDATLLDNGNILTFVNNYSHEISGAIEIDPLTKKIIWEYKGTPEAPFYSKSCGTNQRLPNGNTLLTETENGRAIEVTPDGEIV